MESRATTCEECNDITYHIELDPGTITYHMNEGWHLHLDSEELTDLYFTLKQYQCA